MKVMIEPHDNGIGELLPAFTLVRVGIVGTHRQTGVQHEHTWSGKTVRNMTLGNMKCGQHEVWETRSVANIKSITAP